MVSLNFQSRVSVLLALFAVLVNAHFQLQYPGPRGPFIMDTEPNFCDGYDQVTTNRTLFPLSGGFYSLNSEHPMWTIGVILSTASNPQSFNNFTQVNTYAQLTGEGLYCLPLDLSTSNFTGLTNGENITLQFVFDGGDGVLYQCADVTLESNYSVPSSVSCTNATAQNGTTGNTTSGNNTTGSSFGIPTTTAQTSLLGVVVGFVILALALAL